VTAELKRESLMEKRYSGRARKKKKKMLRAPKLVHLSQTFPGCPNFFQHPSTPVIFIKFRPDVNTRS